MGKSTGGGLRVYTEPDIALYQSGQEPQSLNSAAVTWSLAKELYSPSGPYFVIPMGLLIGAAPTFIQWLIRKVSSRSNPKQVL